MAVVETQGYGPAVQAQYWNLWGSVAALAGALEPQGQSPGLRRESLSAGTVLRGGGAVQVTSCFQLGTAEVGLLRYRFVPPAQRPRCQVAWAGVGSSDPGTVEFCPRSH